MHNDMYVSLKYRWTYQFLYKVDINSDITNNFQYKWETALKVSVTIIVLLFSNRM